MGDSQDSFKVLIALDISETSQNAFDCECRLFALNFHLHVFGFSNHS